MDKLEILLKDTNTELRKYARLNSKFITVQLGPSVNVSEGGICVIVEDPLRIGHVINIIVLLTTTHAVGMQKPSIRIKLKGVVIWAKYSKLLGKYKVGIRFTGKNYYGKAKFKSFIDKHFIETYKYNNPESLHKKKVCMFVFNNFKYDTRVLKEAKTLTSAGYDVRVVALIGKGVSPYEERDGFRIIRIIRDPFHSRLRRWWIRVKNVLFKRNNRKPWWRRNKKTMRPRWLLRWLWKRMEKTMRPRWRLRRLWKKMKKTMKLRWHLSRSWKKVERTVKIRYRYFRERKSILPTSFLILLLVLFGALKMIGKAVGRFLRFSFGAVKISGKAFNRCLSSLLCVVERSKKKCLDIFHKFPRLFINAVEMRVNKRTDIFRRSLDFLDYNYRSYKVVKEEAADIYHAHDLNTLPVAWWAARKHGAKLVYDSHELFTEIKTWNRFEKILYTILERFLIKYPDKLITVNNSIAGELVKRYGIRFPTIIINCPSPLKSKIKNPSNDLLRKAAEIPKDKRLVLYQGGFTAHRGLEELIESFEYLGDDYCLVFMGYGKLQGELENLVDQKGLQNRIKFLPAVSQEVLLEHTSSADLGVIPYKPVSLNNYYTLPNKLFEYINANIPIVASNLPELRGVIKDFNIGCLFNPAESKSIANAIKYVLSDKDRYLTMKANTIKSSKEFNWDKESRKLLDCYNSL